jgi:RNA polymerase sigma-70 factor (ECF subfamily)
MQATATNGAPPHPTAPELLKTLVEHRTEFLDFLRRRTRSGSDAEDLLQQALLLATRKVQALREPALLFPWFYRVLRRVLADHVAQGAARAERLRRFETNLPDRAPEAAVTCDCSVNLLETLLSQYADVIRRVDLAEEPIGRVAASLGSSLNNVTVRLHRARKALRARLQDYCGTTSARTCLDCSCGENFAGQV